MEVNLIDIHRASLLIRAHHYVHHASFVYNFAHVVFPLDLRILALRTKSMPGSKRKVNARTVVSVVAATAGTHDKTTEGRTGCNMKPTMAIGFES